MGTRGAFGFYIDGETKVTYNHFDSYPDGLGSEMASWVNQAIRGQVEPNELLQKVRDLKPVPERDPTPEEIEKLSEWADLRVSKKSERDWYCLLRNTQGDPTALLEAGFYEESQSFLSDSLFCEWAYIINFDEEVFEVYKGFQKEPHTRGRYSDAVLESDRRSDTYYPVALVATFPLTAIPEDWTDHLSD